MQYSFPAAWPLIQRGHAYHERNGIGFFTLPAFTDTGIVRHGCSTRTGGVSKGAYASLNLSFTRPDEPRENVMENYRLFARATGIAWDSMVMDTFEHGVTVLAVDRSDAGAGYLLPPLPFCDGLITDDPGIALITGHADCLPLYLLDPVRRCIGLAHAGWKGTLGKIGLVAAKMMTERYGADPAHMLAGVGPCICADCFEAGEDLGVLFSEAFPDVPCVSPGKPGKVQIDLGMAAAAQFMEAGIPPSQISLMDVCTFEEERLYSHRREKGDTGGMAAFLQLLPKEAFVEKDAFLQYAPQAQTV
jgi:YfiH family protein